MACVAPCEGQTLLFIDVHRGLMWSTIECALQLHVHTQGNVQRVDGRAIDPVLQEMDPPEDSFKAARERMRQ